MNAITRSLQTWEIGSVGDRPAPPAPYSSSPQAQHTRLSRPADMPSCSAAPASQYRFQVQTTPPVRPTQPRSGDRPASMDPTRVVPLKLERPILWVAGRNQFGNGRPSSGLGGLSLLCRGPLRSLPLDQKDHPRGPSSIPLTIPQLLLVYPPTGRPSHAGLLRDGQRDARLEGTPRRKPLFRYDCTL